MTLVVAAGEFPWQKTGSLDAAQRHYAERYRQLSAEADRTSEELVSFLPCEIIRMRGYLEERIARIQSSMLRLNEAASEHDAYQAALREGKQYLLRRWKKHTESVLAEAVNFHMMANAAFLSSAM